MFSSGILFAEAFKKNAKMKKKTLFFCGFGVIYLQHSLSDTVAQLEERHLDTVEVIGSSPVSVTIFYIQVIIYGVSDRMNLPNSRENEDLVFCVYFKALKYIIFPHDGNIKEELWN